MILTDKELFELTGYSRPSKQLEELHQQGFYRARISKATGKVILERESYEAVCAGDRVTRPKLRLNHLPKAA
jgi:hypothetical protein